MKNERQATMLSFIESRKTTTIKEISEYIYSSESTIRRDLDYLSKKGLILKGHGYIEFIEQPYESLFEDRIHRLQKTKASLAFEANKLIKDDMLLFIDSSSTCLALASYLHRYQNLTIVTNGIETVNKLKGAHHLTIIPTGGKISSNTTSMLGPNAFATIDNFYADIFFCSTRAINDFHARESSAEEAEIKRVFNKNARKTVLLFDDSKVNDQFNNISLNLNEIDTLITNSSPNKFKNKQGNQSLDVTYVE